jgi:hypothetical protein
VAENNKQILITSMINGSETTGRYVKPGIQVPDDSMAINKRTQTEIVSSIIKENEDYLGKVSFVLLRQQIADIILFPRSNKSLFCVVAQRPYDLDKTSTTVLEALQALQPTSADDNDDGNKNKNRKEGEKPKE